MSTPSALNYLIAYAYALRQCDFSQCGPGEANEWRLRAFQGATAPRLPILREAFRCQGREHEFDVLLDACGQLLPDRLAQRGVAMAERAEYAHAKIANSAKTLDGEPPLAAAA